MAISITGPDGSTFDFPDGTDHGTISSALRKHYGAPQGQGAGQGAVPGAASAANAEPPEVANIRQGFRAQGPTKIGMGNLMGLTDEINSAGAAAIDRAVGRTDDWNERRKQYRSMFKEERETANRQLGPVGSFAADFVGGMAASPFKLAKSASGVVDAVPALPLPTIGKLVPMPQATTAMEAVVNPIVNTARNLPTLMKTGGAYGAVGGYIGSNEDDAASRIRNAGYGTAAGMALMPGLHLGLSTAGSVLPGAAGTARNVFEKVTGTTPPQRAQMAANKQELLDAGVKAEEIYGPFLRPDGGTWLSKSIANSPAGFQRATGAADRHLGALERGLGNELDATGAPRNRFAAADERQKFLDRQVNQYSMAPERIQYAPDEQLAEWADPLTGHLRGGMPPSGGGASRPAGRGPGPSGGGGGGGGGGPGMPPSPSGPPRGPDIAQAYADARRLRYEGKLPSPDAYWTPEESAALKDMWRYTQEKIQHPETLTNWIIRNGGIKDTGGDIAHMLGKANMRPGLINNKSGMDPDSMARHAWESGFIDSVERPTINDLFAHLGDDLSGQAVVRAADRAILDDLVVQNQFRDELGRHGLTARREADFDRLLKQPIPKEMRPTREPSHTEPPPVEPKAETAPTFMKPPLPEVEGRSTIFQEVGPRAEDAPTFLRRRMQVVNPEGGRDVRAPRSDVGRPGRGMDGEALPPEPPAGNPPDRWTPPGEAPPPEAMLTDKDRIAAMYEQQNRLIPGQARGGMGSFRDTHANDQNIVRVIEDIRRNARAEGRLPGDRARMAFWESPAADAIRREVSRHLPSDVVTSLFERVRVAPRQMMRYRTAVRDADTSNPMTRTTTQTWLPRAENALTQDIEARLARLEDGGAALESWRNSNRQYAAWKEQHVAPLKTVIGENVKPEQAMDKLSAAMKGKDLRMIRAYADAHRRGGQQLEGAGALVSHLMEGGVANFVKEYNAFTPAAKAELFKGQAAALRAALDRYARLAEPAVSARDQMSWRRFNTHNAGLGAAYMMFDMTGTVIAALGQYGAARFLSSPTYVNWLTRAAPIVARGGPNAWQSQITVLGNIAQSDRTERGKEVIRGLSRMLTPPPSSTVH